MQFKYLGETYEVDKDVYLSCKERNLTRRFFSLAKNLKPSKDKTLYTLIIYSTDKSMCEVAYSSHVKTHLRKLSNQNKEFYKHYTLTRLSKSQAEYLKSLLSTHIDFHAAIAQAKEEIQVFK